MQAKEQIQTRINLLVGLLLYPLGDFLGQLFLSGFSPSAISWPRIITIALVGSLLYRFEIPRWFKVLESIKVDGRKAEKSPLRYLFREAADGRFVLNWLGRTGFAMLYFNPLWIARHVFFIYLSTHNFQVSMPLGEAVPHFLMLGLKAFLANLPISIVGNYIIQQKIKPEYRFAGSATLSGIFAISYAIEYWLFK